MSKARDKEKFWQEFERELAEAIAKDKAKTKEERRVLLDTLPEFAPPAAGGRTKVVFFEETRCKGSGCKLK